MRIPRFVGRVDDAAVAAGVAWARSRQLVPAVPVVLVEELELEGREEPFGR
jgi:hypothetical protein